jgi:hypothetical protein
MRRDQRITRTIADLVGDRASPLTNVVPACIQRQR